ncbi:sugar MFS transporter [Flavihumibacter petaseus]|uniref:Putative glucose/galactose transporter n=1 Tax=Flavihumibacter petaseus NBRC 106054 TaxID=1220578 RepID=A0A0E9MXD1_9BACT|nr:sugar MFS transporter [Flavihumibacter petaseus]GAO42163.1 putative glucose/galactose transporter [Flavihumibacter petaseus NBRC 106054]
MAAPGTSATTLTAPAPASAATTVETAARKQQTYAIVIIGILFFCFGFITWLNSTLIPFLKLACQLESDLQAFFVTFAFYMAYFFLALPASRILKLTGYKKGMALGLIIIAIGSLVFIPAANSRNFAFFLTGLFIQGTGLALLQTASNPYISIVGPIESAAKRISIMGICNKIAGALSPLILGAIVLKNAQHTENQLVQSTDPAAKELLLQELAQRIIPPYIIIAVFLILLAALIYYSKLPEIAAEENQKDKKAEQTIFSFPHLWLGVLCLFLYVGVEVLAGDAIGTYGKALGMSLDTTKYFTSFTLAAMLLGYVVGIFTIPRYLKQQQALLWSAILGLLFSAGIYFTDGYVSVTFVALLGLSNALMWPAIFPLAIDGLGKFTQTASALLVMGIAGGAIVPLLYNHLKDNLQWSNQSAFFICCFPAYLYILYYGVKGYKVGKG